MFEPGEPIDRAEFLNFAVVFEGGLMLAAFLVGYFINVNPVLQLEFEWSALVLGVAATMPLLAVFSVTWRLKVASLLRIRRFLVDVLGPCLAACRHIDLILLAVLAGVCEELAFRGFLQQWLSQSGAMMGLIVSNIVFGLVHAVTPFYAVAAMVIGVYLGMISQLSESNNLLVPITTHALYDYIAFLVVVSSWRAEQTTREQNESAE